MAVALTTTIIAVGICVPTNAAGKEEIDAGKGIVYVDYSEDYATYSNDNKAPEYSNPTKQPYGYVFGGWYSKDGNNYDALDDTKLGANPSNVYAKFVPAYVLSVKCQNKSGTEEGMSGYTAMKIVSSMDSGNYASYGFELSVITLNSDGTIKDKNDWTSEYTLDDVYKKYTVYKIQDGERVPVRENPYTASEVFGEASAYFTAWGVSKIGSDSFSKIISIRPCWDTLDGTRVYGLTKYAHVVDGLLQTDTDGSTYRYLNVPINLRKTANHDGVAAGVLSIAYDNTKVTFAEVEGGRFFEEMAWADKADSVKLVGNRATISEDKNADEIYANVRFKVKTNEAYTVLKDYSFEVFGEDFSNSGETQFTDSTYNVWDVKY